MFDHDPKAWVDLPTFAKIHRKSQQRIRLMCSNGDILAFCVATYKDPSGKWWLRLSDHIPDSRNVTVVTNR